MTTSSLPPAITAALDQRIASIAEALDGLVGLTRGLDDDPSTSISHLSMAIGTVLAMPQGPETVTDTLALAVWRLAGR
jgi:hypothetical protein